MKAQHRRDATARYVHSDPDPSPLGKDETKQKQKTIHAKETQRLNTDTTLTTHTLTHVNVLSYRSLSHQRKYVHFVSHFKSRLHISNSHTHTQLYYTTLNSTWRNTLSKSNHRTTNHFEDLSLPLCTAIPMRNFAISPSVDYR